jgi:hypothetical protein
MDTPPKFKVLVKKYLGQAALDIQQQEGRGVWLITADNAARYIPAGSIPEIIEEGDAGDIADLYQMVESFDPKTQVVVIFNMTTDLQMIGVIEAL